MAWEIPLDDVWFDGVKLSRSKMSSPNISLSALVDTVGHWNSYPVSDRVDHNTCVNRETHSFVVPPTSSHRSMLPSGVNYFLVRHHIVWSFRSVGDSFLSTLVISSDKLVRGTPTFVLRMWCRRTFLVRVVPDTCIAGTWGIHS